MRKAKASTILESFRIDVLTKLNDVAVAGYLSDKGYDNLYSRVLEASSQELYYLGDSIDFLVDLFS